MRPGRVGIFGATALPFPSSLLGGKGSRAAGGVCSLSKPGLGTDAFLLGQQGGPSLKGAPSTQGITPWRVPGREGVRGRLPHLQKVVQTI